METNPQKNIVEQWIQKLLESKIVEPDNLVDFQTNLLEGVLKEDSEKIQAACDELSNAEEKVLRSEIEKFMAPCATSLKKSLEEEIDKFLKTQGLNEKHELRERMISELKNGDKTLLIGYVKEKITKKKVSSLIQFIQEFNPEEDDLILKSAQPCQDSKQSTIQDNNRIESSLSVEEKPSSSEEQPSKNEDKKADASLIQTEKEVEEAKLSDLLIKATTENGILQKIKLLSEEEKQVWILYETYEDSSAEYRMKKIKFHEEECENFISSFKEEKVKVQGYYGRFQSCLELAEQYLGLKIIDKNKNSSSFNNEAIIALSNGEKACLLFLTQDEFFDFQRDIGPDALTINYIRILVDLCQVICIAPHEKFQMNPDDSNPYLDRPNPGYNIEEEKIEPLDKVSILQVPVVPTRKDAIQDFDFSKFVFSADFTKNLVKVEVKVQTENESKKNHSDESRHYIGNIQASDLKDLPYPQLRNALLNNWSSFQSLLRKNKEKPGVFEDFFITMLSKFIPQEKKTQFQAQLKTLVDNYLERKKDSITESEKNHKIVVELIYENLFQFVSYNRCDKQEKGLLNQVIDYLKMIGDPAHEKCLHSVEKLFKNPKENKTHIKALEKKLGKNFSLHFTTEKNLESELQQIISDLAQAELNNKEESQKKLNDCRINFFQSVFNMVDPLVIDHKPKNVLSLYLNFYNINIIRGVRDAENFNITLQPVILSQKFTGNTEHEPNVRSLYFIQDNSGLIEISDFPLGKSSLYSFDLSKRGDPRVELFMTLSSIESHFLIELNVKLWCVYDNREQRFNMGKLSSIGKPEGGALFDIFNEQREGCVIDKIISACFLPLSDSFFIINQNYELFELKYHSKTLSLVLKKENHGDTFVQKSKIMPADPDDKYVEIQTTLDGKNIILRSQKCLDIYDLNWNKVQSITINEDGNFVKFKTFVDDNSHFLIIFKAKETVCYQLAGLSVTKTLKTELTGLNGQVSNGNPIFDYLYLAFRQFGPQSSFIGAPSETRVAFLNLNGQDEDDIKRYFKSLNMPETSLKVYENENAFLESGYSKKVKEMDRSRFKVILSTRVPLHVATIENYALTPLNNGKNISDKIAANIYGKKSYDLVEKLTKLIGFGVYEKFLTLTERSISVISIVGRQSSGKSYVMNREFGTRFGVASERCTDGIWISMAEMKAGEGWKLFVVLDCEGLFSTRRNDQEETKLCLTLAALSDVLILNQDLAFNRQINRLFNNFSNSIGKLKGRKLFKGYLMMLIRDVKSEAAEGAYRELQSNIAQVTKQESNFLTALFQGKLKSQCLNYFEKEVFNAEVEDIRKKYFASLDGERWETGIDFLESLKITLAQVFMEDDTDMDMHKLHMTCERRFKEAINMFYEGGNGFEGEKSVFVRNFDFDGQSLNVEISQRDIVLKQSYEDVLEVIPSERNEDNNLYDEKEDSRYVVEEVITEFSNQTMEYSQGMHSIWITNLNECIEDFLEERISYVRNYFKSKMPKDENFKEIIKSYSFDLKTKLNSVLEQSKNCQKTCRECNRICNKTRNHPNNCHCGTSHMCEKQCILTSECTEHSYLCTRIAGHEGDHKCSQGAHKCNSLCSMCTHTCAHEVGHPDTIPHDCQNRHPCKVKCIDEKCTRTCQSDLKNAHTEHTCGENRCIHKCSLCDKQCVFKHHLHEKLIKENKTDLLKHEADGKTFELTHHSCGNDHACVEKCCEKGVCQIEYNVIEKEWANSFGSFTYPFFEPKEARQQCKLLIPKFKLEHQEAHNCKIRVHRCSQNCVECKSFCNKDINHTGFHSTNNHRNKENNVFVSSKGKSIIEVISDGKTRKYAVGEFCQPENCTTSCARKGRAHYHLKECPGQDKCPATFNPYVKHSKERYEPYADKVFDKWLCAKYWNSMHWDVPVQDAVREELSCCNFVCNHYSHGENELVFCKRKAWHQELDHQFDCIHEDYNANLIDIVFCCDTTSSMGPYLESSKATISQIVKTAAKASKSKERDVKFAFVAYRDHPPEDLTYITKMQNLCSENEILVFIQTLTAAGGGDASEAVLDGMFDSICKISWRRTSARYIFHIADAPAHGMQYSGGSGDHFSSGCPCGIKIEDLAASIQEKNIKYKLLKIGSYINTMASVFRKHIRGYEESDLNAAFELPDVVNRIIVRDITTDEQDVLVKGK